MSLLLQYIIKLSVSLALVWVFYYFLLRKLTFYNSNRWYLLVFTLLSFVLPLINIAPLLGNTANDNSVMGRVIPSLHQYTSTLEEATHCPVPIWSTSYDKWDWIMFALIAGGVFLLLRLLIRLVSFWYIRSKARLVSTEQHINVYEVEMPINPFSFGNNVFVNRSKHSEDELRKIILHELVHVRQRHTVDILWAECCCILNWYNPFAWLLRKAIRQNLEFIADQQVLNNGVDKKQYQYLLLKVTGNYPFSIANQFNFSSLKKRIAMMNKNKSARISLIRFVWVLPLAAVILVSFRRQQSAQLPASSFIVPSVVMADTIPQQDDQPNEKGYYLSIIDNKGNCTVVVKDKNKKQVARMPLNDWNKKEEHYVNLYGELPPPPPPAAPAPVAIPAVAAPPAPAALPENVLRVTVNNDKAEVFFKDGKKEQYNLANKSDKDKFEKEFGALPAPPTPPAAPVAVAAPVKSPTPPPSPSLKVVPAPSAPSTPLVPVKESAGVQVKNITLASTQVVTLHNLKTVPVQVSPIKQQLNLKLKTVTNVEKAVDLKIETAKPGSEI